MPTQHEMANRWVGGAMKQVRETGESQTSKDWGYGDRKRSVTIASYDQANQTYTAYLLCWGFPEREVSGKWDHVFPECVEALAGAG